MESTICQFYNPYFKSGCFYGRDCDFVHLNKHQYAKYCQRINRQNPPTYRANKAYKKCRKLISKRHYRQSMQILHNLAIDYPFHEQTHTLITKCYSLWNHKTEAKYSFQKLISLYPYNPIHHNNYSMFLYRKLRNYKSAKIHFLTSLQLIPNHKSLYSEAITHALMAKFLFEAENNIDRSQYHFETSLELNFNNPQSHYNYAILLHTIGYMQDAEYHFKKSISIDRNRKFLWHHFNYALLLEDIEKYNESEQQFIISCKLAIKSKIYHKIAYQYGLLLVECLENCDLGLHYLNTACELRPKNRKYSHTYDYYKTIFEMDTYQFNETCEWMVKEDEIGNYLSRDSISLEDSKSSEEKKSEPSEICMNWNKSVLINGMPSVKGELERFLKDKVFSNNDTANEYYEKFAKESMNDIRFIGLLDENMLKDEIGITSKMHRKMFIQQQQKFLDDCLEFEKWLAGIKMKSEYGDMLSGNGILTFDTLYYYVHNPFDLAKIIGEHNKCDANFIWNSTPKMSRNKS